ncbi:MAG TPA: ABC transporter substrate-binding protein, partial [Thermomicrobiales bacterium]|nr:ABC transporter substrate-binding protein [Thermomicrobiales bacterium]
NAQAVKASFDRIVDPNTKSGGALTAIGPYDSSEVVDDYTVKVNFKQPNGAFLTMLSTVWLAPQSPDATAKYGQDYQDHVAGTGPFMLKEYVHNDHVTLVRNPDYNWAPDIYKHTGPALLDQIIFTVVTEDATRVAALKSGDLDLIDRMPPRDLADLSKNSDYKTMTGAAGGVVWTLALHVKKAPTEDPAVRKAIMMTYDAPGIVDLLFQGTLEPAYNLLEPTMTGYNEDTKSLIKHDPEGAKKVLEDAGWKVGSGGIREKDGQPLKLALIIFADWGIDEMAVTLQAQLKEVGIDMEIKSLEQAAAHAAIDAGEHNAAFTFSWWADPSILRNFFGTELIGHGNKPNYSNPQVDQWLIDGLATTDDAKRAEIYNKVVSAVMSDAAAIPFFQKRIILASKSKLDLDSVAINIEGYPNFYDVGYLS